MDDWLSQIGTKLGDQVIALPFALVVALWAAAREAGYGHRLSRLYDLADKAEGAEKEFFRKRAAHQAQRMMSAEVRFARINVVLVALLVVLLIFPYRIGYRLGLLAGTAQDGYSAGAERDASVLEALLVLALWAFILYRTVKSLILLARQHRGSWRGLPRWTAGHTIAAFVTGVFIILCLLIGYALEHHT